MNFNYMKYFTYPPQIRQLVLSNNREDYLRKLSNRPMNESNTDVKEYEFNRVGGEDFFPEINSGGGGGVVVRTAEGIVDYFETATYWSLDKGFLSIYETFGGNPIATYADCSWSSVRYDEYGTSIEFTEDATEENEEG